VRRIALILAALSISLALGGCSLTGSSTASSGSYTGNAGEVAATLNELSSDASSSNESDICDKVLATRLVDELNKLGVSGGCEQIITNQLKTIGDTTLTIESNGIAVKGKTATAHVQTVINGKKTVSTVLLVEQPAGWRIASLGASTS
jgi:hypothetical protein